MIFYLQKSPLIAMINTIRGAMILIDRFIVLIIEVPHA